jgi:hypothetical protein
MIHRSVSRIFRRKLGGEWRGFARALETSFPSARPGYGVSGHVRDRNDRVVEGGRNMRHPNGNILFDLFAAALAWLYHNVTLLLVLTFLLDSLTTRPLAGARIRMRSLSTYW